MFFPFLLQFTKSWDYHNSDCGTAMVIGIISGLLGLAQAVMIGVCRKGFVALRRAIEGRGRQGSGPWCGSQSGLSFGFGFRSARALGAQLVPAVIGGALVGQSGTSRPPPPLHTPTPTPQPMNTSQLLPISPLHALQI